MQFMVLLLVLRVLLHGTNQALEVSSEFLLDELKGLLLAQLFEMVSKAVRQAPHNDINLDMFAV